MRFVLVNRAAASFLVSSITDQWLSKCADALTIYLDRDVAYHWGGSHAVRVGDSAAIAETALTIVDDLPEAPDAIAYHSRGPNGEAVVYLALSRVATLDDVSKAASHELAETVADVAANLYADGGDGYSYAAEIADPCQGTGFTVNDVLVSDFVFPSWFAPGSAGPYATTAEITAPFTIAPGGYVIRRSQGTGETELFGAAPAHAPHWASRAFRRTTKE